MGVSAITLLELATLFSRGALRVNLSLDELFADIEDDSVCRILPLSLAVAKESALLRNKLRDPADCVIVATARVHGLRLLTSDQRIIESNLVSTVE
jgi:PIN domain nuclease of toxin-antitoxin system